MELEITATPVLKKTIQARKQNKKLILHQGGSRSSKTWSIYQYFFLEAMGGTKPFSLTIVRDKLTWIKATLLRDLQEMVSLYHLPIKPVINFNRGEQVYDINGSEFAFFGCDDPQKFHGRTQDYFWVNETMEVGKKHFDQLEMRTRIGGFLDYNPYDDGHWVFELPKRNDVELIKSTMLDNPFVPDKAREKILSYEPTEENKIKGTADPYMWEVYGLGNKAKLRGVIFDNWDIVDEIPEEARFLGYGQDFGYTNDPTTLIALYKMDNELYWDEVLYQTNLTNQDIVEKYKALGIGKIEDIRADSSEPKSIEEIRRQGYNIRGADKGSDSIMYGVNLLKQYKMHITKRSINVENELRKYKYQEDKNGNPLNKAIDDFNHCIDAMRYIAMAKLGSPMELQTFSRHGLGF